MVKVLDPVKPSQKEIDEHELTHLPFRNRCRECVHGRGVEMPHRARIGDDGDRLMKLNVDFMFLGPRGTDSSACDSRRKDPDDFVECRPFQNNW